MERQDAAMRLPRQLAAGATVLLLAAGCSRTVATTAMPAATEAPSPTPAATTSTSGPGPVLPRGTFVARAKAPALPIFHGPAASTGTRWSFSSRNAFGQPIEFLVTKTARDAHGTPWLRILVPTRPNDAAGWVREADVVVHRIRQRIVVDLSARSLTWFRDGHRQDRFPVGIGAAATPTATGTFYVWAQVPQASPFGPYGVFALGLSGFSPVLTDWPGGGRMAIHGTSNPADQGQMVSHGCVRVYNPNMSLLRHVPMGTPVVIHA